MENINQLYLIGMMGSGKSSTGKTLSLILDWDFVDIDNEIEDETDSKIIFKAVEGFEPPSVEEFIAAE